MRRSASLRRFAQAVLFLAFATSASARDEVTDLLQGITPLFADHALLDVSIEAPFKTLMRERPDEEYLAGVFRIKEADGTERSFALKLRTRGNYRRDRTHCDFTPIRLNFQQDRLAGTLLAGQDKLKLVTHCRTKKPYYEQLVLREYLAYRILNLLTPMSYSVRLLRLTYVDTERDWTITKLGFVIEDDDHVATRNGLQMVKTGDIEATDLEPGQQNLVNLFQYMIGNTEYSLNIAEPNDDCCHNSDLMSVTGGAPYVPLAFDFDFSGLVTAPYAEPNPRYRLRSVRHRLYKGHCRNNDRLPDTIQLFLDRRDAVFQLIDELELLDTRSRNHAIEYLGTFYERISDPKQIRLRLVKRCDD